MLSALHGPLQLAQVSLAVTTGLLSAASRMGGWHFTESLQAPVLALLQGSRKGIMLPMLLTLLSLVGFFGLAMLAAIFISANHKATERRVRKKRAQRIKQRLQDE